VDQARGTEIRWFCAFESHSPLATSGNAAVRPNPLGGWVRELGIDRADCGMHTMRRTEAALIYRRTKNQYAAQLLLGHSKLNYIPHPTISRTCSALIFHRHAARPKDIAMCLGGQLRARGYRLSLEPSCGRANARVRAIGDTSSEHLSSFVDRLSSQQYSAGCACIVAKHALAFGRSAPCGLRGCGVDFEHDSGSNLGEPGRCGAGRDTPPLCH
jgi:hypothetical protein